MRILCCLCIVLLPIEAFSQARLLWEVEEVLSGHDNARAIALSHRTAIFVGTGGKSSGGTDLVTEALKRSSGAVKWTDRTSLSECCSETLALATLKDKAFVAGIRRTQGIGSDILVRGYDVSTGALLWEDVWDAGQDGQPRAIAASPVAVIVVGYGENGPGTDALDFLIRAYEPVSGTVLWEDQVTRGADDAIAWEVDVHQQRVFVAGTTSSVSQPSNRDLLLRAYDIRSGEVEWQVTRPSVSPTGLAVASGRVFLVGNSANQPYVAAFRVKNGEFLWEDRAPGSGTYADLAFRASKLVVAGSNSGLLVRLYDAASGAMEWEDNPETPLGVFEGAAAIGLNDDAVYIAGTSSLAFVHQEIVVRAYRASDGALLWDDRAHRSPGFDTGGIDLALGKHRLFVAGTVRSGSSSDSNFLVRAYDIRFDTEGPLPVDED